MIHITRFSSGAILLQRDDIEITIDAAAIPSTLGPIILSLIDQGRALGEARRQGYDAGLLQGYAQCEREQAMSQRIAQRQETDLIETLISCELVAAA